jgi:thiosulfate/3-mercaptopyruvate sulfurtransferase
VTEIALDELSGRLDEVRVLDVRTLAEFDGTAGYHCDPRQGHIPGAVHLDVQELTTLAPEELRERLGEPGEIVVYCHSGARSAFAAALLRGVGYEARNYPGSWHEWSRTDLPREPS